MPMNRRQLLAASALGLLSACERRRPAPPLDFQPNIVVFLSDALRADCLGCYGYGRPTSPFLDTLRRESVFFEHCYSQGNWTKPSVASLFTGLMPRVHRTTRTTDYAPEGHEPAAHRLREGIPTLAEHLAEAGYSTGSFIVNPHIVREFGFTRGFDHSFHADTLWPDELVQHAERWVDSGAGRPFFSYVHVFDPHGYYDLGRAYLPEIIGRSWEESRARLPEKDIAILDAFVGLYARKAAGQDVAHHLEDLSPEGVRHLKALYLAEVRTVDDAVRRMHTFLGKRNLLDRTVFVFTADHGEGFNRHAVFRHGVTLFNEETRVPWVMRLPGGREQTVSYPVGQFDIHPTLLHLAGITPPDHLQARSVFSRYGDIPTHSDRPVFTDQDLNGPVSPVWGMSMVAGRRKVIRDARDHGVRYHDLAKDPLERVNLAAVKTGERETYDHLLKRMMRERHRLWKVAEKLGPAEVVTLSEEKQEALRALGYL